MVAALAETNDQDSSMTISGHGLEVFGDRLQYGAVSNFHATP